MPVLYLERRDNPHNECVYQGRLNTAPVLSGQVPSRVDDRWHTLLVGCLPLWAAEDPSVGGSTARRQRLPDWWSHQPSLSKMPADINSRFVESHRVNYRSLRETDIDSLTPGRTGRGS